MNQPVKSLRRSTAEPFDSGPGPPRFASALILKFRFLTEGGLHEYESVRTHHCSNHRLAGARHGSLAQALEIIHGLATEYSHEQAISWDQYAPASCNGLRITLWLTFRQAHTRGGTIRKGEKACPVVFWKRLRVGEKDSTEEREIPLLRYYHVFNVAQCRKSEER